MYIPTLGRSWGPENLNLKEPNKKLNHEHINAESAQCGSNEMVQRVIAVVEYKP